MKVLKGVTFVLVLMTLIGACTKTETKLVTQTSAAESAAILLAGPSGSSKSWQISQLIETVGSGAPSTLDVSSINSCESDNIYTFSNNATQTYTYTEGGSICTKGDTTTLEAGTWGFTDDGKTLIIDAVDYVTNTQYNNEDPPTATDMFLGYLLLNVDYSYGISQPLTVTALTANSLTLSYSLTGSGGTTYLESIVLVPKK